MSHDDFCFANPSKVSADWRLRRSAVRCTDDVCHYTAIAVRRGCIGFSGHAVLGCSCATKPVYKKSRSVEIQNMASQTGRRSFVQRSPNGRPSRGDSNDPCAIPTHHWNKLLPNSMVFTSWRQGRRPLENCRPARFSGPLKRGEPSAHFGDRSYTTEANLHQASFETVPIRSRFSFHTPLDSVKTATKDAADSSKLDSGTKEHPVQTLYRTLAKASKDIKEGRHLAAKANQQSAEQAVTLDDEIQLDKRKLINRFARFNGPLKRGKPRTHFGGRSFSTETNDHQAIFETVPMRSRFFSHTPLKNGKSAAKNVGDSSNVDSGTKEHPVQKLYRTLTNHVSELGIKEGCDPASKADQQSAEQAAILEDEIQLDKRKLIFNYLPNYVDEWLLRELCGGKDIGDLVDCRVARRRSKGQPYGSSCGYAFLTYTDVESAERAKAAFDKFKLTSRSLPVGSKVDDVSIKQIKVSYCRPSHDAYKDTNVFVTGIPCGWTREQVHELFSQHGSILSEKTAPRGQCKCFKEEGDENDWSAAETLRCEATDWAFILYARRDSALDAIQECNGMQLSSTYPRILKVTVANNCKSGMASV